MIDTMCLWLGRSFAALSVLVVGAVLLNHGLGYVLQVCGVMDEFARWAVARRRAKREEKSDVR